MNHNTRKIKILAIFIQMSSNNHYFEKQHLNEMKTHNTHLQNLVNYGGGGDNDIGDNSTRLQCFIYGHDGVSNQRRVRVDTDGHLQVDVLSGGGGDASAANQTTMISHLSDIKDNGDTVEASLLATVSNLDTLVNFSGQPNSIGDGSNMMRGMNYFYDSTAGQQRPGLCDSAGKVQVYNANVETKLDTLETTLTSIETKLDDIDTLLTSLVNGANSHQNLYSNGSLAASTLSTTIDMSNHRHLSLFGKTTSTSGTLYLALSTDNVNYYVAPNLSTYVQLLDGVYYFGHNFANIGAKYVRVYTTTLLSNLYMSASMKN